MQKVLEDLFNLCFFSRHHLGQTAVLENPPVQGLLLGSLLDDVGGCVLLVQLQCCACRLYLLFSLVDMPLYLYLATAVAASLVTPTKWSSDGLKCSHGVCCMGYYSLIGGCLGSPLLPPGNAPLFFVVHFETT